MAASTKPEVPKQKPSFPKLPALFHAVPDIRLLMVVLDKLAQLKQTLQPEEVQALRESVTLAEPQASLLELIFPKQPEPVPEPSDLAVLVDQGDEHGSSDEPFDLTHEGDNG